MDSGSAVVLKKSTIPLTPKSSKSSSAEVESSFSSSNGLPSTPEEEVLSTGLIRSQSETRPEKSCAQKMTDYLRTNLHLTSNGVRNHEAMTSPLPVKHRAKDEASYRASRSTTKLDRRARSLAGPSPNCRFGPKAQLFEPESTGDRERDDEVIASSHDPGNTRLNWYTLPQSVLVIKKARDQDVLEPFIQLLGCLLRKDMVVFVEQSVLNEENLQKNYEFVEMKGQLCTFVEGCGGLNDKIDFIVCLGGDGTLLYAGSLFQTSVPPVMAFHLGSLGFLTPFEFEDVEKKIESVLSGHAKLTLRSRLKCELRNRDSRESTSSLTDTPATNDCAAKPDSTIVVLNDVVIDRGPSPYLVHIDLFVDGQLVTSVQGDGLIISTPTGSTAYAVAAGASIIHPGVPAIMITPICPHSLSFRPIVVPAGCDIRIKVSENARDSAWVSFDGRNRQQLNIGDTLRITTSIYPLPSICAADQMQDWFNGLASCLHWNVRKPQKPLV